MTALLYVGASKRCTKNMMGLNPGYHKFTTDLILLNSCLKFISLSVVAQERMNKPEGKRILKKKKQNQLERPFHSGGLSKVQLVFHRRDLRPVVRC